MTDKDKQQLLKDLEEKMAKDDSLPLKKGATRLVFGVGNAGTDVLFIGEGPGYWEDQKGIPFVGNAGALLNQLLLSIELKREDVYITNVVHHRPPNNRDPEPEELTAYKPYLDKIIGIINPKVIVTLGRYSMGKFLPGVTISSVHGRPKQVSWKDQMVTVVPMYHPAAGLRSTNIKQALFADFKRITEVIDSLDKKSEDQKIQSTQMELI